MKIKLNDIIIGERQRKEYGDLSDLMSMADPEVGQIQPILVSKRSDGKWDLVAGGRRCAKAAQLQWDEIEAYDRENLTSLQKQVIELIENKARKGTEWWEDCLALYEIHTLKSLEVGFSSKGGNDPNVWTREKMAVMAGCSIGRVSYLMQAARLLKSTPRYDAEGKPQGIWKCEGYKDAVKYILQLHQDEVDAEINRRRAAAKVESHIPVAVEEAPSADPESNEPNHPVKASEGEEIKLQVLIHAKAKAFDLVNVENDIGLGTIQCFLGVDIPETYWPLMKAALRPNGFAVIWFSRHHEWIKWRRLLEGEAFSLDYPLIWNRITPPKKSDWPYAETYWSGIVVTKGLRSDVDGPLGAVVTSQPDDSGNLPVSVVNHSIRTLVAERQVVYCLGAVDPVTIAELGRIPFFHEEDPLKFEATVGRLRDFYIEQIPDVEVKVKE